MGKNFTFHPVGIVCLLLAFAVAGVAQQDNANAQKKTAVAGKSTESPAQVRRAAATSRARIVSLQKKLQKVRRSIVTGMKIDRQSEQISKLNEGRKKALEEQAVRQSLEIQKRKRVTVLGQPTGFSRAPFVSIKSPSLKSGRAFSPSLASPVLIGGKDRDTVQLGDSYDVTFSFSPGYVSAIMSVYLDADGDGTVSSGDILLMDRALLLDNGQSDLDQSEGKFRYRVRTGDNLSHIAGNLIFQIDDYSSVGSAMVTVDPRRAGSVVNGITDPPIAGLMVELSISSSTVYSVTDSSGKFTALIPQAPPYYLYTTIIDPSGKASGYLLPQVTNRQIYADTASVLIKLTAATSFAEGTVKDYDGNAIHDATVYAYGFNYYYEYPYGMQYRYWTTQTKSDSDGHYKLGLLSGQWYLSSEVDWTNQYLSVSNQPVLVPSSGTVRLDLSMPKSNASISGKVTLNSSGIGGIPLSANSNFVSNYALSGSDGTYSIPVFDLGVYTVYLSLNDAGYVADVSSRYTLSPDTGGIDFKISKVKGGATGKVTNSETNAPVANAVITFSGPVYLNTMTDDSGSYRVPLTDGTYYYSVSARGYLGRFNYRLTVAGRVVTEDIPLVPAATISGKVTNLTGAPLYSANIIVYDSTGYWAQSAYTDYNGDFYVNCTMPGKYKVEAQATGYMPQWYNGKDQSEQADYVSVTNGNETSGIDFSLSRGGIISGRVTNSAGEPLWDVQVVVYDTLYSWYSYAYTDDNGEYTVAGLNAGKYVARANLSGYAETWYDGQSSFETATRIPAALNQTTPHIDFTLLRMSTVSGKVSNKITGGIPYADVVAMDTSLNYSHYGYCDSQGDYQVTGLTPGPYYMMAYASGYAQRWYDNAATVDSAKILDIESEEDVTGIDFILPKGAEISGKVMDAEGSPLAWAGVYVYSDGGAESQYTSTQSDGTYVISGLMSPEYFVSSSYTNYITQWYDHKSDMAKADTVHVQEDSTAEHIDFNLAKLGGISGNVYDYSTNYGLQGIAVQAIGVQSSAGALAFTDYYGHYSFILSPGKYKLRAFAWGTGNYDMSYFSVLGNAILPSQADVITIPDAGGQQQADFRLHATQDYQTLSKSRLSLVVTNNGRFGTGSSLLPNGRWPDQSSPNYLADANFIFGGSTTYGDVVSGSLGNNSYPTDWTPLWNYDEYSGSLDQTIQTYFTGSSDTVIYTPELGVSEKVYAFNATDYAIVVYKLYYTGAIFTQSLALNDVYLGDVFHFKVSNGKDIAGKIGSQNLVFVCDTSDEAGINLGVNVLEGATPKIGWWKVSGGPGNVYSAYNAMKTSATTDGSGSASDYRLFVSSGPYSLSSGDSVTFAIAVSAGMGRDSLSAAAAAAADKYANLILAVKQPGGNAGTLPTCFMLYQNYPNPFNPSTSIRFDLKSAADVRIAMYNVLGQRVEEWNLGRMAAGRYERSISMERYPSGVYFYSIVAVSGSGERFTSVKKMVLLK